MARLVSLVLVLFLSLATSSHSTGAADLKAICQRSKNPTFCYNLLKQKSGADLVTIAQYTIDVTRADVSNTVTLVKSLISQARDPKAKQHYQECLLHFGPEEGALGDIERSQEMLRKQDYPGLNSAASAVYTDVDDCINGKDLADPSMLPRYANVILQVVDITLVISNILMGRYSMAA